MVISIAKSSVHLCVFISVVAHVQQDVTTHLMNHLSLHPTLRTCSSDTILRAIKELTQENISSTSDTGKNYDFNTDDTLNSLLLNCMFASGQQKEGEMYDVDFDHQFMETENYDAKSTYKKFFGYRPGVAVIGDLIVGIENSDGNTSVRFHQEKPWKQGNFKQKCAAYRGAHFCLERLTDFHKLEIVFATVALLVVELIHTHILLLYLFCPIIERVRCV